MTLRPCCLCLIDWKRPSCQLSLHEFKALGAGEWFVRGVYTSGLQGVGPGSEEAKVGRVLFEECADAFGSVRGAAEWAEFSGGRFADRGRLVLHGGLGSSEADERGAGGGEPSQISKCGRFLEENAVFAGCGCP